MSGGRRIGRFELLRSLGEGAHGAVFEARDGSLGRTVALKLLRSPDRAPQVQVERLRREGEALARLRHPNVVAVHEAGSHAGTPYVVLELVQGTTLAALIVRHAPRGQLLDAIEQAARGVAAAHGAGVLHRDLKPSNILVGEDGRARVADFGVAAVTDASVELTRTGITVGSFAYMAPEIALCQPALVGPASDVYSLGATLYEALTGCVPHEGLSNFELLSAHERRAPILPPSAHAPGVSPALDALCLRALARDPGDRPPTAAAFALALAAARRPAPLPRSLALAAATATLVLAGAAAASFLPAHHSPGPAAPARSPTPGPRHAPTPDGPALVAQAEALLEEPRAAAAAAEVASRALGSALAPPLRARALAARAHARLLDYHVEPALADAEAALALRPEGRAFLVRGAVIALWRYGGAWEDLQEAERTGFHAAWEVLRTRTPAYLPRTELHDPPDPGSAAEAATWAKRLLHDELFRAAVEHAGIAIARDPASAEAWLVRGQAQAALGDKQAARADLEHALDLARGGALEPRARAALREVE